MTANRAATVAWDPRDREQARPRPKLRVAARRRKRRRLLPVAFVLVLLIMTCAVAPVAINMAGLHLESEAVKLDAMKQDLRAQIRDVQAEIASLNSTALLQEQAEKLGMESVASVGHLTVGEPGNDSIEVAGAAETAAKERDAGVAWLGTDSGASSHDSDSVSR